MNNFNVITIVYHAKVFTDNYVIFKINLAY